MSIIFVELVNIKDIKQGYLRKIIHIFVLDKELDTEIYFFLE